MSACDAAHFKWMLCRRVYLWEVHDYILIKGLKVDYMTIIDWVLKFRLLMPDIERTIMHLRIDFPPTLRLCFPDFVMLKDDGTCNKLAVNK